MNLDQTIDSEQKIMNLMLLDEVRKTLNKKGKIHHEIFSSTGKCKECEEGLWQYNYSVSNGERKEEHFMCINDCGIVSSIVFSVEYKN